MDKALGLRLAREIRAECARQGLTQETLASATDNSVSQVSRRLSGRIDISVNDLFRFALALGVPADELLRRATEQTVGAA